MKVLRRRDDAGGSSAPPAQYAAAAARPAAPKVLVRSAAAAKAAPPQLTKEEIDSKKVAQLLEALGVLGCDGSVDMAAAVGAAGFGTLQVFGGRGAGRAVDLGPCIALMRTCSGFKGLEAGRSEVQQARSWEQECAARSGTRQNRNAARVAAGMHPELLQAWGPSIV
jgi:hypothetical protein